MSLDIIWLNAYGGTGIVLVLMVSLIYALRKIGTRAFNILSILFLLNFAVYQFSVLIEINSFYHNYKIGISTYVIRFISIFVTGFIYYLGVLEQSGGFILIMSGKEKRVIFYTIILFTAFLLSEFSSATPFAFISDKYDVSYSAIIKRFSLLSYSIIIGTYTFLKFIKPSLKSENSVLNIELISIFQSRYIGIIVTFIPSLFISVSPYVSSYWITIQMLLYSTMTYMQFISNTARHSKNDLQESNSSSVSIKKKEKMLIENGEIVLEKLMNAIEQDKLYLDSNISLNSLSSYIKYPSHVVSIVINNTCKMSFIQLINSYRVEDAKDLLLKYDESISISSIALEVGFNSVSTFNRAFKKSEGVTPSHFQKLNKIGELIVSYG